MLARCLTDCIAASSPPGPQWLPAVVSCLLVFCGLSGLWFSAQCGVSELSLPYFQFWPAEAEGQSHHVPFQPSFLRAW